jgi:CBS domain-containing protein
MDIAGFLADHPPFRGADPDVLTAIASAVRVEFFPAGTTILEPSDEPTEFLYVVRKGGVEILDDGRIRDLVVEGELFGELSIATGLSPVASVRAAEDTICYLVPRPLAEELLRSGSGARYLASVARRSLETGLARAEGPDLLATVGAQLRRPPVTVARDTTVAEAAAIMSRERVSSLLVPLGDAGWGILTDRDLRTRVVAAGRSHDTRVAEVMTSPIHTVSAASRIAEVLLAMLEKGIHHLPVTDAGGRVVGMVTDTDLLGLARQSPFALRNTIERAADTASAVSAAKGLPTTVASLVDATVDPVDIGHVVSVTIDALTRRLLELGIARLGDPPAPWAWLALGSEARREQSLYTDQDHALALGTDDPAGVDPYFAELAHEVTSGLADAGIHRCDGNAMAEHPALRRSLDGWADAYRGWIADPGGEGSVLSSIAFDHRQIAGELAAEPVLDEVVRRESPSHPWFAGHLGRRALDLKPPTGFFRDFVVEAKGDHAGRLDIKHGGITIVTNIARAYDVRGGRSEKGTLARLRAAADAGELSEESREALEETFRLLWGIRLEHQVERFEAGLQPDDFVDPKDLGPVRRRALKEAFRIITLEQRALGTELGVVV